MPNFGAANFKSVDLDGKPIDTKFYQVRNGSIILTIEKAFLNTLSVGEHALNVQLMGEGYEGQTVGFRADCGIARAGCFPPAEDRR